MRLLAHVFWAMASPDATKKFGFKTQCFICTARGLFINCAMAKSRYMSWINFLKTNFSLTWREGSFLCDGLVPINGWKLNKNKSILARREGCKSLIMCANGPAMKGRLCYPTRAPGRSWFFSRKMVTVQGGYGTCFCSHGIILIACWRDRGTNLIEAGISHGSVILLTAVERIRVWNHNH